MFQPTIPISSLKSYMGHTFGACGAIEAWLCIRMMAEGWLPPTINLDRVGFPAVQNSTISLMFVFIRPTYIMSNNFAFGGIYTH